MSNPNDPIYCFNGAECTYEKSGKCYDDILGVCHFEWMKEIMREEALHPERQSTPPPAPRGRSQAPPPAPRGRASAPTSSPSANFDAITKGAKGVKVQGIIKKLDFPELQTKNGPTTVCKILLASGSEELMITFWDESVVPRDIQEGNNVEVSGLLGSEPYNGTPQASGLKYTKVKVIQ